MLRGQLDKSLCRFCADEQPGIAIFSELGEEMSLCRKLELCHLPFTVTIEDVLPTSICYNCIHKLNKFNDFYHTSIDKQDNLKEMIAKSISVQGFHDAINGKKSNTVDIIDLCQDTEEEVRENPISKRPRLQFQSKGSYSQVKRSKTSKCSPIKTSPSQSTKNSLSKTSPNSLNKMIPNGIYEVSTPSNSYSPPPREMTTQEKICQDSNKNIVWQWLSTVEACFRNDRIDISSEDSDSDNKANCQQTVNTTSTCKTDKGKFLMIESVCSLASKQGPADPQPHRTRSNRSVVRRTN